MAGDNISGTTETNCFGGEGSRGGGAFDPLDLLEPPPPRSAFVKREHADHKVGEVSAGTSLRARIL